jgi:hypothetical protein
MMPRSSIRMLTRKYMERDVITEVWDIEYPFDHNVTISLECEA